MANYFKKGTIVLWTNDGEVVSYNSIDEVYEKENIQLSKDDFVKALGTDREVASGVTAFRYGLDIRATEGYDEAADEIEQYEKEQEAETMKKISNAEIAKKLYENEKIASHFTFNEILDSIDICRSTEEEAKKCDIKEVVENFEHGFLERIEWVEFESSK